MQPHREKAIPEKAVRETFEVRRELNATQQLCAHPVLHAQLKAIVPAQSVSGILIVRKDTNPH